MAKYTNYGDFILPHLLGIRNDIDKNGRNVAGINQCKPTDMDMDTPDLNWKENPVNHTDVEVKKALNTNLKNNTRCVNMSNM